MDKTALNPSSTTSSTRPATTHKHGQSTKWRRRRANPANYKQISRIVLPPPGLHAIPTNVTTLAFDNQQELLWAGNEYGRVSSFFGSELTPYTSVKAHPDGSVRQLLFHDIGVISISTGSVHLSSRRGLTQWHIMESEMQDLRCMTFIPSDRDKLLVAGCQPEMFVIDVEKGEIIETVNTAEFYTLLKSYKLDRYICAATTTGSVNFLDPRTFEIVKSWKAHASAINDMDTRNGYLVTCGYSPRQIGTYMFDMMANVYDFKKFVPLTPIPFPAGAAFVRMHPKMQTTCIIASQTGQLQVIDIMNPNTSNLRQADISTFMISLELAPSGEALAMADGAMTIHLWGSPTKIHFTEVRNPVEFADEESLPTSPERNRDLWNGDLPLSSIGMPYYTERLLSAWPGNYVSEVGNPPLMLDPQILEKLVPAEMGKCAPYPRKTPRYQRENTRSSPVQETALIAPKFLSEKARESTENGSTNGLRRMSDAVESLNEAAKSGQDNTIPPIYTNIEIRYSKFGVDDFDFAFYNKTCYSGLETHIANSYANSLLQLLRFTPLFRNLALHHAAVPCMQEYCLLCEMGFLFDMLEKAAGQNCQATNLLKTFSSFQDALQLGLLEENLPNSTISNLIQSVSRFFMQRMQKDFEQITPNSTQFRDTFTIEAMVNHHCSYCRRDQLRADSTMVTDLLYPVLDSANPRVRVPPQTFSSILKSSLQQEVQSRAFCENCKTYRPMHRRRSIHTIPDVLMLNTRITKPTDRQVWARSNFLPSQIGIILDASANGSVYVIEGADAISKACSDPHRASQMKVYDLVGLVADITPMTTPNTTTTLTLTSSQRPHLVSLIDTSISSATSTMDSSWHLFNDFLVRPVSTSAALSFTSAWKTPCILTYQAHSAAHTLDQTWKDHLDLSLLFYDWFLNKPSLPPTARLLSPQAESPLPGFEAAIDTEFVTVERAEIDVKPDGKKEVIRPTRQRLARVSVLRGGKGDSAGIPFIDDYIASREMIIDYVTEYSGIRPGDLDIHLSTHPLVPLKLAYKKLWLLLNMGVVFIGHGLSSDFRQINIHVPKDQYIDTQKLFYIPRKQRKLSLRFVAWAILREWVQEGGPEQGHDSIEDARTALRLWWKWQELQLQGEETIKSVLEDMYRDGQILGFKPPPNGCKEVGRIKEESLGNGSRPVTPRERLIGESRPSTPVRVVMPGVGEVDLMRFSPRVEGARKSSEEGKSVS